MLDGGYFLGVLLIDSGVTHLVGTVVNQFKLPPRQKLKDSIPVYLAL